MSARVHVGDQKFACIRFVGFGSRALETTEGILGLSPHLALTGWVMRGPWFEGQHRGTIREERVTVSASVDEEVGRACLRVTTRMSEVDTVR